MVEILSKEADESVAIRISGKVTANNYSHVIDMLEKRIKTLGKVNLYCEILDVEEIDPKALWKDLKFDIKHFNDFRKVALVSDRQWLDWGAKFARPFTTADVKIFDFAAKDEAMEWINAKEHV